MSGRKPAPPWSSWAGPRGAGMHDGLDFGWAPVAIMALLVFGVPTAAWWLP